MVAQRLQHWASISPALAYQYRPYHDKRSPNASLMLAHRLRPWLSSKTALAKRLFFFRESPATRYTDPMLEQFHR